MQAGLVAPAMLLTNAGVSAQDDPLTPSEVEYITAARTGIGRHNVVMLDKDAQAIHRVQLPERAHGAASHRESGVAAVFARRPGYYMCCLNLKNAERPLFVEPPGSRHFYGHGVYVDDGRHLLATENDIDSGNGIIGIYDAQNGYRRIGEFASHGIGPHDVIAIPNQSIVAVANGGVRTHPDSGREKLNLPTMQASVSLLDTKSGELIGHHVLPDELHQLSIRHLTHTYDGKIWFACQFKGKNTLPNTLVGSISVQESLASFRGGRSRFGLHLLTLPASLIERTQGYLSSIASHQNTIVCTSSRAGLAFMIDGRTGAIVDRIDLPDCSGAAEILKNNDDRMLTVNKRPSFMLTSGTGRIQSLPEANNSYEHNSQYQWDNHLYKF